MYYLLLVQSFLFSKSQIYVIIYLAQRRIVINYTTLSNFINNAENIISNTITNEEHTLIKTEEGNAVLIPEAQYNCLLETLARKRKE